VAGGGEVLALQAAELGARGDEGVGIVRPFPGPRVGDVDPGRLQCLLPPIGDTSSAITAAASTVQHSSVIGRDSGVR
jgi:hypothetical protein